VLVQRLARAEHLLEMREMETKKERKERQRGKRRRGGGGGGRHRSGSDAVDSEKDSSSSTDLDTASPRRRERRSKRTPIPVEILERHPLYVALKSKSERAGKLLAQSERERLELRQKYVAIGQNVEQLIKTDAMSTRVVVPRVLLFFFFFSLFFFFLFSFPFSFWTTFCC
jgi:hypothetical protein